MWYLDRVDVTRPQTIVQRTAHVLRDIMSKGYPNSGDPEMSIDSDIWTQLGRVGRIFTGGEKRRLS